MTSIHDICERWAQRAVDPSLAPRRSRSSNVFVESDRIYSYGTHFEIGRVIRATDGSALAIMFNGDRYSPSTTRHQDHARSAVMRHAGKIPTLIVPYTALRAARIDIDTVQVLDVKPEGYDYSLRVTEKPPMGTREVDGQAYRHFGISPVSTGYASGQGGLAYKPAESGTLQEVRQRPDGMYEWHSVRHWLGDSVFSARVIGSKKRVRWLSSFDKNEPTPLYFLCQLPPCTASTYEEAIEALKPDTVKLAEAMGREVERQGDIFAVPMPGLTLADLKKRGGQTVRRSDVRKGELARNRAQRLIERLEQAEDVRFATPEYVIYREQLRSAVFGNLPWGTRQAVPLTGLDWHWKRTSAQQEARERIAAISQHRRLKWRGLIEQRVQAAIAASADPVGISLLGTSHTATHVVTMPDGTQYVRGTMYHDPALMGEDRERDHVRRKLGDGKTWHIVAKNTVPVAKPNQTTERTAA